LFDSYPLNDICIRIMVVVLLQETSFAEAGEFDTAREILRKKEKE